MPLRHEIRLIANPWPETVPQLGEILTKAAGHRAAGIEEAVARGEYPKEAIAFVVLDPTAPSSRPTEEALLALICIGEEGERYAPNAMAKAAEHRDHGAECGSLVLAQKHRLADGDFRHGFSIEVSGTIVAASGQSALQDQYEATMLAAELNYEIARARERWEQEQGRGGWYSLANAPGARYRDVWLARAEEILHSS